MALLADLALGLPRRLRDEFAKQTGPVREMNPIGGILPVLASLTGTRTCRTANVSVGGRGLGQIPRSEVACQIMQYVYTNATFHPRLNHFAPESDR